MKQIWVIRAKSAIEFRKGDFTNWENDQVYYGIEDYEEAEKEIVRLRKSEVTEYKNWLHDKKGCFIHHNWYYESLPIF